MHVRKLSGFLLLGAFWASASCGSDNKNSGIRGFGIACETDKECVSYSLLCGLEDKCVQCLEEDDCERSENCMAGLCKVPQDCEDSRDCADDLVCNETLGSCVQCITTKDCPTGRTCAKHNCVLRQACEFTSDCVDGLLCDADAGFCVACRDDDDCPSRRVCEDNECVSPSSSGGAGGGGTGGGGTGGRAGSGGKAGSGGGGRGGGGAGGVSGGASGGSGEGGEGPLDCGCSAGTACTPDLRCVSDTVIDDFFVCDDEIVAIQGRHGVWSGGADLNVDFTLGYGDPGTTYEDRSCAAWMAGSAGNGAGTAFAFMGFTLNGGQAYDLSAYSGLLVRLESGHAVQVVLKTIGGGSFQATLPYVQAGTVERTVLFSSLTKMDGSSEDVPDLVNVSEVQFAVPDRTLFGVAIHGVALQ